MPLESVYAVTREVELEFDSVSYKHFELIKNISQVKLSFYCFPIEG